MRVKHKLILLGKNSLVILILLQVTLLNIGISQDVQVEINGLDLKPFDTVYVIIKPIRTNDTLDILALTQLNDVFFINYKYATGENLIRFDYLDNVFDFLIEFKATKVYIDIGNHTTPSCLIKRRFYSCGNSSFNSFGRNCTDYNYCVTNYCEGGDNKNEIQLLAFLDSPSDYKSYLNEKEKEIDERIEKMASSNGVWYFHKVATREQRRLRRIKKNSCGFRDSLLWLFKSETLVIGDAERLLVNSIGKSNTYNCTINPITYEEKKELSSCPSDWYVNYRGRRLIIRLDNSGLTLYTYWMTKRKLFLHQLEFDENGNYTRGKRFLLRKNRH